MSPLLPPFGDRRRIRVGLLGGSFNPAHGGHLHISREALKRLELNQVWWLVSPQNPLKPEKGMMPLAERMKGARALAKHPRIVVTDIETRLGTRYTVDTLAALKKHFPRTHFVWLMGADNLRQLPRWRRWQDIFKLVPIAIFPRPGYGRRGKAAAQFAARRRHGSRNFAKLKAPVWTVLDNPLNYESSTAIRKRKGL